MNRRSLGAALAALPFFPSLRPRPARAVTFQFDWPAEGYFGSLMGSGPANREPGCTNPYHGEISESGIVRIPGQAEADASDTPAPWGWDTLENVR